MKTTDTFTVELTKSEMLIFKRALRAYKSKLIERMGNEFYDQEDLNESYTIAEDMADTLRQYSYSQLV